ncbi:MAG TPA: hypothetical protein VFS67_29130 [Polyangiaceae bacterium]|jgi:hypothetical protein|nr:hypothetical protein [Polyangiaceae bacterium]
MQSFLTTCAVIGALGLAACGSPSELDEDSFPDTYADTAIGAAGSGTLVVGGGGQAGSGGVASGGSAGSTGNVQTGGSSAGSGSTVANPPAGGCPSDITVLFNRPSTQGGCAAGGGCHDGAVMPNLVAPNVLSRLLNVPSMCSKTSTGMSVAPRPYIGKDDSFLKEKVAGSPNAECGVSMPFFMPQALSEADRKCIVDWIDSVKGG